MHGKNTSCPVAEPAVSTPTTSPRLRTNHWSATVAAKTSAIDPVPRPIMTPHVARSIHGSMASTDSAAPPATSSSATVVTRRMPKRAMSAAANGAVRPNSTRFTVTASDSSVRLQPNSSSSGTMSALGAARKPAAPTSARNATAATIHAG